MTDPDRRLPGARPTSRTWWPTSARRAGHASSIGATPARTARAPSSPRWPSPPRVRCERSPSSPSPLRACRCRSWRASSTAGHQRARQHHQRRARPEHVKLGMKVRLTTYVGRHRRQRHRGHRLRLRAGELRGAGPWHPTTSGSSASHDQVRQAPGQGHRRPGLGGSHGRARRRRRHHEGHGHPRLRQPDVGQPVGQQLQKQIGQTGIPVFNVANACATGATALRTAIMAIKAGEADMGLAVGVEKLAGPACSAAGRPRTRPTAHVWTPSGRYGAVVPTDGRIGTDNMPGVFAQVGMEYGAQVRRCHLRTVRQDQREEPRTPR
jgi:hypothetical protein